jgi:hypothetical protein
MKTLTTMVNFHQQRLQMIHLIIQLIVEQELIIRHMIHNFF